MGWLEDALASIAASGEGAVNLGPPTTEREREMQALVKAGSYGAPDATSPGIRLALGDGPSPVPSGRIPFGLGGDPMTAGGDAGNGPGLPPPDDVAGRLRAANPALSTMSPGPQMDLSTMANPGDWSPFGPAPAMPNGPPPRMAAQAPTPGLNSPMGGSGAPFSIAGVPPSMAAAKEMTAPPPAPPQQMAQQPPVSGLVPPGDAPGVPAGPGGAPVGAPTEASARRRDAPPAAAAAAIERAAAEPTFTERMRTGGSALADALRESSPHLIALGAGLQGEGWNTAASLAAARNKRAEDMQLQSVQGNATARLLASRGASPAEIQAAAVGGPEAIKALLGEYLGKDKWKVVQTGEDGRGRKTFMQENQTTGAVRKLPGAATSTAENASDAAASAGIVGDEFLKTIPDAQDRSIVRQLANYDLDPGKVSAKRGNRERLLALAEQYDPDYKAVLYAPRAAALKEFTSGGPNSPASIITNGNTAIQHLGRMSELSAKLGGTNRAWILNGVVNWANVTMEDMKNNPDLAQYKGAEDRFVEEATKFYRGVGGNKSDIERALNILKAGQSPEARQAAIEEQANLMQSKVNALQDRFKTAIGPSGWKTALRQAGTEFPIVQEKSAAELEKIRKRAAGERVGDSAAHKPAAAGQVKVGDKVIPWSVN